MNLEIIIPPQLEPFIRDLSKTGLYGGDYENVAVLLIRDAIRQCVADNVIEIEKTDFTARESDSGGFVSHPTPEVDIASHNAAEAEETAYKNPVEVEKTDQPTCRDVEPAPKPVYPKPKIKGSAAALLEVLKQADGKNLPVKELSARADIGISTVHYALNKLADSGLAKNAGWKGKPHWIAIGCEPKETSANRSYSPRGTAPLRRFTEPKKLDPENATGLKADHDAVTEGRTLFPSTVVDPSDSPRLLVSGINSSKTGDRVTKGKWKGMPLVTLTLEERASCPKSCAQWQSCYGNGMPMARRHRHGPELISGLREELSDLQEKHPHGFIVRLHILGDFYNVFYVNFWNKALDEFPALHVFGYTAHPRKSEIGSALKSLTDTMWNRFAIRFSDAKSRPQGATVIDRIAESPVVPEGIVCPAQTGKTACCGTCGLCWSDSAKAKTIVFMRHGRIGRKAISPEERDEKQANERQLRAELGRYFKEKEIKVRAKIGGLFDIRGEEVNLKGLIEMANEMRAEDGLELYEVTQ